MFQEFVQALQQRLQEPLPGETAHQRMAPANRVATRAFMDNLRIVPRQSAVLILMFPAAQQPATALIRRPDYEGVHSGQIAFPGGKYEEEDGSLEQTALREAFEEVGILPEQVTLLGALSQVYIPPSNFLVSPFIGIVQQEPLWVPDQKEVAGVLTPTLHQLMDKSILDERDFKGSSGKWSVKAPYFRLGDAAIWGATAMIISELNEVVGSVYPLRNEGYGF